MARHLHLRGASLLLLGSSGLLAGQSALAADSDAKSAESAGSDQIVETVIVTGARTEQRTVLESPAPIDVLSAENIRRANQTGLIQTLNNTLPSFNVPGLPTYGINSVVRAGQLRGLNSSHTLVLVNGKRRHTTARLGAGSFAASAPADLGLIPTGSIERIEVLRDGASAIYGSDAIAGVINIITRKEDDGFTLSARTGQNFEDDGQVQQYVARGGFAIGEGGHLQLSAQYDDQERAFRDSPVPDNILFYFPHNATGNEVLPVGNRSTGPLLPAGATPDAREAQIDRDSVVFGASGGVPEASLASLSADFALPFGGELELYGVGSYSKREGESPQHFRFPSRDQVVRAIWPDGFTPYSGIKEDDYSVQLGLRGDGLAGWNWDLSTVYGNDTIDAYQYDSNSPSYGLASKTDFFTGRYESSAWTSNFDLRRHVESGLFGKPVDLSAGLEYRREEYSRGAGEEQSWNHGGQPILDGPNAGRPISISDAGSQADTGVRPEDTADDSRNSYSVYGGLSIYPSDPWVIDLAARYEDYSDFGDIVVGRLSTRYEITPSFALRATASTGFQAPALAAQSFRATGVTVSNTNHTLAATSPEAQALGARPLEPEESTDFGVGFVAKLWGNTNLAVDFYQIDVDNRISQLSTFSEATHPGSGVLVQAASPNFGPNDGISYLLNAGDSRTRGADLTLDGVIPTADTGSFKWTVAANYNETELVNVAPTPPVLAQFNIPIYNAASRANLEYLSPKFKGVLGLNWNLNQWSAGLRGVRYGEILRSTNVNQNGTAVPVVFDVGDLWVVDAEFGYEFSRNVDLRINVNNALDQKPKKLPADSTALWPFQSYSYINNSPVGATGGFYSATITFRL